MARTTRALGGRATGERQTPNGVDRAALWPERRAHLAGVQTTTKQRSEQNSPCIAQKYWTVSGLGKRGGFLWQIGGSEWVIGPSPLTTPRPALVHEQDVPAHHHRKPLLPSQRSKTPKTRRATTRLQPVRVLLADKEWHHHAVRRHARERPRTLGHLPVGRRVLVDLHRWWTR